MNEPIAIVLDKELARDLAYESVGSGYEGYEVVLNEHCGEGRWHQEYELVLKRDDGKYWRAFYHQGSTENQDERAFEYTEPVFTRVYPQEKTIVGYVQEEP